MIRLHVLGKSKLSSNIYLVIPKANIEFPEREIKSFLRNFFTVTIALMVTQVLLIGILLFFNNVRYICI